MFAFSFNYYQSLINLTGVFYVGIIHKNIDDFNVIYSIKDEGMKPFLIDGNHGRSATDNVKLHYLTGTQRE